MLKYLPLVLSFFSFSNSYSQIVSDTINHVYVGKLKYTWNGKEVKYSVQFNNNVNTEFTFLDEQLFEPFPSNKKGPFHYSYTFNLANGISDGVYIMKNDTLYNAIKFLDYSFLSDFDCLDYEKGCCNPPPEGRFFKNIWYKYKAPCNKNVWRKFKGYQLVAIHSEYNDQLKVTDRFIFVSELLR